MNFKFRNILMPLAVGAAVFSCEQKELDEVSPDANAQISEAALSSNLLYNETFEDGTPFDGVKLQSSTTYGFGVASNPVFEGAKSGRFELRDSDPLASSGTRSEFLFPENTAAKEGWYSFAGYFPAAQYLKDSNMDHINQWHQGSGSGTPALQLLTEADQFKMSISGQGQTRVKHVLGTLTKDKWHQFVIHIVHSAGSDGLVEVWLNGAKVLTRNGPNMYADFGYPRWKVGIYKDDWNGDETTDTKLRVFYVDNVKLGTASASLTEMTSGTPSSSEPAPTSPVVSEPEPTTPIVTEPAPSTQGVTGFALVDAATEKDVLTITDGSIINLNSLANTKLNVRAITNPTTVGSVKFALSGAQSKTFTDNAAPYALHGDNGSGNFYYGNWNPPATGTYTLTATPYSGSNGSGTASTPVTISFTITTSGTTVTPAPTTSIVTEPAPSTQGVTGFALVDAATEKDVLTITDGSTISLSKLANTKLNVRAITNPTTVGSVKFALSGAQSKTFTDNAAPYALHGDNGSGNFYYGNWNPPATGTYTLTATPYSGSNGSGTASTPVTINFTITQ